MSASDSTDRLGRGRDAIRCDPAGSGERRDTRRAALDRSNSGTECVGGQVVDLMNGTLTTIPDKNNQI